MAEVSKPKIGDDKHFVEMLTKQNLRSQFVERFVTAISVQSAVHCVRRIKGIIPDKGITESSEKLTEVNSIVISDARCCKRLSTFPAVNNLDPFSAKPTSRGVVVF